MYWIETHVSGHVLIIYLNHHKHGKFLSAQLNQTPFLNLKYPNIKVYLERVIMVLPAPIGAPIEYPHSILHVSYHLLRAIPVIHEINALREVFGQRVGKFLLKSIIALWDSADVRFHMVELHQQLSTRGECWE